jgi:hypothetical protein
VPEPTAAPLSLPVAAEPTGSLPLAASSTFGSDLFVITMMNAITAAATTTPTPMNKPRLLFTGSI